MTTPTLPPLDPHFPGTTCQWYFIKGGRCKHTAVSTIDGEHFCARHAKPALESFNRRCEEKHRDAKVAAELAGRGVTFTKDSVYWDIDGAVYNDEEIQAFLAGLRYAAKVSA